MLPAGNQLGAYRVVALLGAGGMGEVYLAEDTRLRRRVALKVLPAARSDDETSQKRLMREAQTAAALEHPNICTVYDVGEADGRSYIAMQYVEGETLASRMARQPLDAAAAISIATQIAGALAEAHRQGVIHRDLKPQNVMLTTANQVKVLDFGLAKITTLSDGSAATATLLSEDGAVAGTVPYMSPEQIRGDTLDARTDIFSFGSLLFEMIGRAHPFASATPADTMSAILSREAPELAPAVPAELQRIIRKCLEKDRQRRYQTVHDLLLDLENLRDVSGARTRPPSQEAEGPTRPEPRRRLSRAAVISAIGLLVAGAGTFAFIFWPRPPAHVLLSSDNFEQLTNLPDIASAPVLSPDGRMVAFIRGDWFLSTGEIYVKQLPNGEAVQLTNDRRHKYAPAFSPDGTRVAYTVINGFGGASASWDTYTVPVLGGPATRLLPNAAGLTWIGPREVLFSAIEPGAGIHMGLVTANEDRSSERRIYLPEHERGMAHLSFLSPDRQSILTVEMDGTGRFRQCRLVPFDGKSAGQIIGPEGSCTAAAWSPDGRWMYFGVAVNGVAHLWRQRFPDGPVEPLTSGTATQEVGLALAADGRSLITAVGQPQRSLWVHDSSGDRPLLIDGYDSQARVSADGKRVYCLVRQSMKPSELGIAVADVASSRTDRLLADSPIVDFDVSRDEQQIAFTTRKNENEYEIWLADLDRRSPPRLIVSNGDSVHFGRSGDLVYRALSGRVNYLNRIDVAGRTSTRVFDQAIFTLTSGSPDGEWVTVGTSGDAGGPPVTLAVPVYGGEPLRLCHNYCPAEWSLDGRYFLMEEMSPDGHALVFSLAPGKMLPPAYPGVADVAAWSKVPGVQILDRDQVVPGPSLTSFVFERVNQLRNLYRVTLR